MNPTTLCSISLTALLLAHPAPPAAGPVCNAGGPYVAECNGPLSSVQLDGTASFDPDGLPLEFRWSVGCTNGYLDDPNSPAPTFFHPVAGCSFSCGQVDLWVHSSSGTGICVTQVAIDDTTPPLIVCPPDTSALIGRPYDPTITGMATATDACSASPIITWNDTIFPGNVHEELFVVRTWVADDGCQTSTCDQVITLAPYLIPHIDIRPGECPNPFTLSGSANAALSVPVSVLGNAFDPAEADPSSLRLSLGLFQDSGEVDFIQPLQVFVADAGTPFVGAVCDCHTLGPDGLLDLSMRFSKAQMAFGLGLINEPIGTQVPLTLSGTLLDGTPFRGVDCVLIQ